MEHRPICQRARLGCTRRRVAQHPLAVVFYSVNSILLIGRRNHDDLILIPLGKRVACQIAGEPRFHVFAPSLADVLCCALPQNTRRVERACHRAHVQQPQQAGEGIGVAVVRRGGQQQQMSHLLAGRQRLCQLPAIHAHALVRAALVRLGNLVRFVHYHNIPTLLQNLVLDCRLLGIIHRGDKALIISPRVGARRQFTLHLAAVPRGNNA